MTTSVNDVHHRTANRLIHYWGARRALRRVPSQQSHGCALRRRILSGRPRR